MVRMARAGRHRDPAKAVTIGSLGLALVAGAILFGALAFGASLAHSFFAENGVGLEAAGIAAGLLVLLGVIEFLAARGRQPPVSCADGGIPRSPMLYTLIGHWVVGAPIDLYLCEVQHLGITGVWIGLAAGHLALPLLTLWLFEASARTIP